MKIEIDDRVKDYCVSMALGYLYPVNRFMNVKEIINIVFNYKFSGQLWTIPIILPVKNRIKEKEVNLVYQGTELGKIVNVKTEEIPKKEFFYYFNLLYKADENHPLWKYYENYFINENIIILSGDFITFDNVSFYKEFLSTYETNKILSGKKWVAFQTRNPIHRAHEYLIKVALELYDGVVISPLVGNTKKDDIPAKIRMQCYNILVENYFPKDRVKILPVPIPMHYGGSIEAIFHMKVRENMGCSYMIIGRDHAGVNNYYGTYEAQELAKALSAAMEIKPLCFENAFYCDICKSVTTEKTCPHSQEHRVFLSGTLLRKYLSEEKFPPEYLIRPEVYDILLKWKKG